MSAPRAGHGGFALLAALVLLGAGRPGVTGAAPARSPSDSTARAGAPRDTTRGNGGAGAYVPADSLPSDDAREVLRTIPEPLPPGERGPAPGAADSTGAAPRDTAASDSSGVPVPAPTAPLGEVPGRPRPVLPADSTRLASPAPPAGPASSAGAAPDTCWRVQLAAPLDSAEAAVKRQAAESQLLVPVVIEREKGRLKVRTGGCLGAGVAEALRVRALAAGFRDAFRIRMTPGGAVGPAKPGPATRAKPAAGAKPGSAKRKPASKPAPGGRSPSK